MLINSSKLYFNFEISFELTVKGKLIAEGKTKRIYQHATVDEYCYIESKDRITAGDGVKSDEMKDKSIYSTRTNAAIFEFLNSIGVATSFVGRVEGSEISFIAKKCHMIPIEWVTRRIATGSFLRRHPNVKEGFRFAPVKLETFYKDDANHDPFWSLESIREAKFPDVDLREEEIEKMCMLTRLVFEVLERAWQSLDHALIDMKIEFGVTKQGEVVLSDVIDNDSWRLWPNGDKRLMLDKQVYRNLEVGVDNTKAMEQIRSNFATVAERTENLFRSLMSQSKPPQSISASPSIAILMGSKADQKFAEQIVKNLQEKWSIYAVELHVSSAHKSTQYTMDKVAKINQWPSCKCIIAIAGRSNGLGPVVSGISTIPVINCPPISDMATASIDIWSSMRLPSGLGCTTILGADNCAMAAAQIVANNNAFVWSKVRCQQTLAAISLMMANLD